MTSRNRVRVLGAGVLSAACFLTAGAAAAGAQAPPATQPSADSAWRTVEEHWYTIEFAGAKAGWQMELVETDGHQLRTTTEMSMRFKRGPLPIEIRTRSSFVESPEGKPMSCDSTTTMSKQPMRSKYVFHDDHVMETTRGREIKHPLPEGEWFTPAAAQRHFEEQRKAGAGEVVVRVFTPDMGLKPVTVVSRRQGEEMLDHQGESVTVEVWKTLMKVPVGPNEMEIEGSVKVLPDGTMVMQETSLMGLGSMSMRLTSKGAAQADAGAMAAPEMLLKTFVTPNKPIPDPHNAVKATLKVTVKQGQMPTLPQAGAQRVELSQDATSAMLTIDLADNVSATAAELEDDDYRKPSAMVDSDDALIQKLAKRAAERVEGEQDVAADDAMRRAESLRRLVRRHISKKGMETAFASASETARMRTGDCSEHGVLLCALLRADGIPARVATGLVYVDEFAGESGIFGWHMWTQALISGKWVDFDATLPHRYSAAHILTATSSLGDGEGMGDLLSVMKLLGNIDIEVLDVEHSQGD